MKDKYVVGLDYGTLSARAAVVCCTGGVCAGEQVKEQAMNVLPCARTRHTMKNTKYIPQMAVLSRPDWSEQTR